jgi:N-acetylglucosamine-6-phosphate deacetylase
MDAELGRIEVGRLADLVVLDAEWNPVLTLVQGNEAAG